MAGFVERVVGAATLNVSIYEDIEADKGATIQALAIVVLSSLAVGVAQAVGWFFIGGVFSAIVALIGLGIRELSMSAPSLARAADVIHSIRADEATEQTHRRLVGDLLS